ncbi:MAG: Flp family type IVb pilin [Xanthobacteraceae bacterium]
MAAKTNKTRKAAKSTLGTHLALLRARAATNQDGATAIEYALVASGIGAAVAATVWSLGTTTAAFYQSLAALLP